jgi:hypothetical protein
MSKQKLITIEEADYDDIIKTGITPIPKNFFVKSINDVFDGNINENHEYEQFFWTKNVVDNIIKSIGYNYIEEICCFTTPSLAHQLHQNGQDEVLLDIDKRFSYLPKFKYYDAYDPKHLDEKFRLLIIDPPFFAIPIEIIRDAVDIITNKNYNTKIIIAYIKRNEKRLRIAFKNYKLFPTNFPLEYVSIKSNKWSNFVLYSNIELPNIKRMKSDLNILL